MRAVIRAIVARWQKIQRGPAPRIVTCSWAFDAESITDEQIEDLAARVRRSMIREARKTGMERLV